MKASLFVCVILVAIFFMLVSGRNSSTTDEGFEIPVSNELTRSINRSRRIQPCRRSVQKSCTSTKMTCGRLGKANICQAFKNDCQRQLSNCDPKKFYRKVHQNLCRGMPVDVVRPCGS
ncbi:uncharacterized protein LOC128254899 isoform X1 [Drosophila gunungcola]|uniref:uncharacterized protein LOC128254899 isoform X1 n=1 Tax=Drosophila gunungcola TaxID=103775 RepID=UPI0022E4AF00|nr:uncharacterized protein LOC128254899 isoform X1 [Drosophila gunungcola]